MMGEVTGIAWCDHTFNAWLGCTRVSPGCENCYAEAFVTGRMGRKVWGVDAPRHLTSENYWKQPARWNRAAERDGVRRRVFCSSLADVFEIAPARNISANVVMNDARRRLFALIEQTPHLDWLLLTKRPQNIMKLVPPLWQARFPENVWVGTTAEDQQRYDERWPILASVPASIRFISHEPATGPIEIHPVVDESGNFSFPHWVITGGESGPGARPYDLGWARSVVEQCRAPGIAPFVKQLGADPVDGLAGCEVHFRDRKGGDPSEWPEELRVQEFPR